MWAEFHFLRPWWLALLPVGVWLIWQLLRGRADGGGWRTIVDAALRAHVLAEPQILRESRWPLIASLCGWVLAVVALAGPAWERLPVPAFRSEEALVVAFDLSRSMDATDVEPSRLARARAEASRSPRMAHRGSDGARRVLDACVHGDAAHDRHAHDRGARGGGEHGHHADAGQLALVRSRESRDAAPPDGSKRR